MYTTKKSLTELLTEVNALCEAVENQTANVELALQKDAQEDSILRDLYPNLPEPVNTTVEQPIIDKLAARKIKYEQKSAKWLEDIEKIDARERAEYKVFEQAKTEEEKEASFKRLREIRSLSNQVRSWHKNPPERPVCFRVAKEEMTRIAHNKKRGTNNQFNFFKEVTQFKVTIARTQRRRPCPKNP